MQVVCFSNMLSLGAHLTSWKGNTPKIACFKSFLWPLKGIQPWNRFWTCPQSSIPYETLFVLWQEENPSRECTIVRTAGKLTPFHFNRIPESDDPNAHVASRRRQKKFNLKPNESIPPESYCPICYSPLSKSDHINLSSLGSNQTNADIFGPTCCPSCQFQILPKEPSSMEHFYSLLPQQFVGRAKDRSSTIQRQLRWEFISKINTTFIFQFGKGENLVEDGSSDDQRVLELY